MGYTAFPHKDPECAGSFQDLNEHRISIAVTQALQSGLAVVEAATTATAHALMQTFLSSRRGPNDEDLMELLSFPTEQGGRMVQILLSKPEHPTSISAGDSTPRYTYGMPPWAHGNREDHAVQ